MMTRLVILDRLRSSSAWVTGSDIGAELHITRSAVAKHVQALRIAGYSIEACCGRGYRFVSPSSSLLAPEVRRLSKCATMGKTRYMHFAAVGSTNTSARELAERGGPEGAVVVAEMQLAGKGRKGRDWASPPETGIYATLLLRPTLPLEDTPLLTLISAIAAAKAVAEATGLEPMIKWPNDILVNGKKVAGILTEVSSDVDRVEFALIGLGINVNTPLDALPERPIFPATSLAIEAGAPQSRTAILAKWLDHFEVAYNQLIAGERRSLLDQWKSLANIIGRRATIQRVHDTVEGAITDIDADGALLLKTPKGDLLRILSGDVSFSGS